jgi:hypothetical protein
MNPLERRIASALVDDAVTSIELSKLISETQDAIKAAEQKAEHERAFALDPLHSPDAVKAREAMASAEFARDRLRTVLPRLEQWFEKVRRVEAKNRWVENYEITKAKVDAAAEELKSLYSEFVYPFVDLMLRIRQIDAESKRVMDTKPSPEAGEPYDGRRLLATELVARGVISVGHSGLTLDGGVVLPDFTNPEKRAWPPYEVPWSVQHAETIAAIVSRPRI